MGGEKSLLFAASRASVGSPLHGRGKGLGDIIQTALHRITPAWAGKRSPLTASKPTFWDHPRTGGEKPFLFYGGSSDSGSPPRGRGKDQLTRIAGEFDGITPAWAGKRG